MSLNRPQSPLVEVASKKQASNLTQVAADYGHQKVLKPFKHSLVLAIFAGAFISLAFVFYITVTTGAQGQGWGMTRLVGGLAFSLGLILVVVCGGELFTSTVLSSIAWAQKRVTRQQILSCWARVYIGNFIGAMLMLSLIMMAKLYQLDHGNWGLNVLSIAIHKLEYTWWQAFSLGVLCNLLVCLGIWMSFSSKESASKSLLILLPVAMFVSSGFEHSIANMFIVPLGIAVKFFANGELLDAAIQSGTHIEHLTISTFIFTNLIPVTLGNIFGGAVLVGLAFWSIENHSHANLKSVNSIQKHHLNLSFWEQNMLEKLKQLRVADLVTDDHIICDETQTCVNALKNLIDNNQTGAAVLNSEKVVVGFISQQDLLRALWGHDFELEEVMLVKEFMQTPVCTLSSEQSLLSALEPMIVDQERLYPVNNNGFYMGGGVHSFSERLARATSKMPSCYPVVDGDRYVGILDREAIATWIVHLYQPKVEKEDLSVA